MNHRELKFIHITKCAGTSIEAAGLEKGILWGKHHLEYGQVTPAPKAPFWHILFPNISPDVIEKYDWFMVVRNPYDRIMSEYYSKWGGIGRELTRHTARGMNQFVINKINTRRMDGNHYTEQYKYLHPTAKIHVLKFEQLESDFNGLMELYDLKGIKLQKRNTREDVVPQSFKKFTVSDFSSELIELINHIYDQDFVRFGYKKVHRQPTLFSRWFSPSKTQPAT